MDDLYNLKGKTAWIIGGKRIGQKVAEMLAQHRADLVISYNRSKKEAEETVKKIKKYGIKTLLIKADASSRGDVTNAVKKIKKYFKKIDILVLMASAFEKIELDSITEQNLIENFNVHILGTFIPIQESLKIMPRGSHIITLSESEPMDGMYDKYIPYFITKGAVAYLTKALAHELGPRGIFVNSIAPGPILKPEGMDEKYWMKIRKKSIITHQIDDSQAVEEFARLVLYLSTVKSTGSVYPLNLGHL